MQNENKPCEGSASSHGFLGLRVNDIYSDADLLFVSTNRKFESEKFREAVKLYVKLAGWFTVSTPIGDYNPDWAIVLEKKNDDDEVEDILYLVRETKDTRNLDELRPDEKRKILSGKKHFEAALGVNYDVITSAEELTVTCI